jgi:carotenoid 1,2-hydratase
MNLLSGIDSDFHHPQKNPGAYEWWHFDGTDDTSGYSFSAQFYAGNPLSPYYQQALIHYWKKTKSPLVDTTPVSAPAHSMRSAYSGQAPNPMDFCGVHFRVFKNDSLAGEFNQEYTPGQLKASDHQPAVLLGSNRFNWDPEGNPPSYTLTLQGNLPGRRSLRARLFLTPESFSPPSLESSESWPTHTWVLAAPRCRVEGTLQWCDAEGEVQKEQPFIGNGYHDHHFGTVPLDRFVKSWHWGRAFFKNRTLVYSVQIPADEKEAPTAVFLLNEGDQTQTLTRKIKLSLFRNRRNVFWMPYAQKLLFEEVEDLADWKFEISHNAILSDGPVSLVFQDQVTLFHKDTQVKGQGMSNLIHGPRLSNHFFFPMLKGKTDLITRSSAGAFPSAGLSDGDVFTDRSQIPPK